MRLREENAALMESLVRAKIELAEAQGMLLHHLASVALVPGGAGGVAQKRQLVICEGTQGCPFQQDRPDGGTGRCG